MKKIVSVALLFAFVFGPCNILNVSAATLDQLQNDDIQKEVTGENSYTLTLKNTTSENLEIQEGETVVLDLNGKTLNNTVTSGNISVDVPTIKIAEGGTLTIKGSGSITRTTPYSGSVIKHAIIDNYGTLNLEDGYISPQGASNYGIYNHASGTLNMIGGRISTLTDSTYGLWNEGVATISGGRFDQNIYPGNTDYAKQPAVVNSPTGTLNISGGEFINLTGHETLTVAPITGSKTTITGGKFEYQDPITHASKKQDIASYLSSEYEVDEYGNVTKKENPKNEVNEQENDSAPEEDKGPDTADVNIYGLLTIMLVSGLGLGYVVRKRMN